MRLQRTKYSDLAKHKEDSKLHFNWATLATGGIYQPKGGGSSKGGLDLGALPSFQAVPEVAKGYRYLQDEGIGMVNGLTGKGPEPQGLLADTINLNPDTSRLATERYVSAQEPVFRRGLQDITNTLEANNQLTGSTTGSSIGNYYSDYMAGLTSANANQALADIDRALSNRVGLYGTGLNTVNSATGLALQDQGQMNQFALSNYENQVAGALASQPLASGGMSGALSGAIGGGLAGLSTGNPYVAGAGALAGGLSGYSGAPTTGGNFLTTGASLYGSSKNTNPFAALTNTNASSVYSGSGISGGLASAYNGQAPGYLLSGK